MRVFLLILSLIITLFSADKIVSHPSELKYEPFTFTAPNVSDYYKKLKCGADLIIKEEIHHEE